MKRTLTLLGLIALLKGGALMAQGRPVRVQVRQPLDFGDLLAGVPTTVLRTDPLRAGEFTVMGQRNADILIDFLLPAMLNGPAGASVLLTFGPGSVGFSPTASTDTQIGFDPAVPSVFTLPGNGRAAIYLGGVATPPSQVVPGAYTNTLTLLVAYLNN